jgi:hypothetical protein
MTKRYDVCSPRARKDGKTFWHRVGTAFEGDKGIGIEFDSLPMPDAEGRVSVRLFEPKAKDGAAKSDDKPARRGSVKDDMDDSIPF